MFRKKRGLFGRAEKGGKGARQGGEMGGFGEGEGDGGEDGPQAKPSSGRFGRAQPAGPGGAGAACGPGLRLAGAGGGGVRQAGERESRRGEGGPQGAPAQPEPAAEGRRNRRRRFALRAVPPDGAAARNGLLRRKWQDWKVKGMFTSLYGKNVLQYIIGKLPEKITPPRAGSKEHRL